ncbi:MAG: sulfotransferase [Clostridia bacterium]|nr:sulfotransferase [Clostridia bacterium]
MERNLINILISWKIQNTICKYFFSSCLKIGWPINLFPVFLPVSLAKKKKRGVLLPPAVGYSVDVLIDLCINNQVSPKYYFRLLVIWLINLINWPFRTYERLVINPRFNNQAIEKAPIFIIGHWRSGTTHLHNLLCQDSRMGFVTTYQSVFPDTLFNIVGRFLFHGFTKLLIPGIRKGDNVALDTANPQEEEFALGDKAPVCFYYFWMFPKNIRMYYDRFIRFRGLSDEETESWESAYKLLIKKTLKNTGSMQFLSKNPPNTARIKVLLEMFPEAKFIHIHRNPVEVFLSTRHFYIKMLPHLQLHTITQSEIDNHIFAVYKNLMKDFLEQKQLIPDGNFVEIAFADLEHDPLGNLKTIYEMLDLKGFEDALPFFQNYQQSMESYEKNKHSISRGLLEKIRQEWGFAMKEFNYDIPEKIEITP